MTLKDLNKNAKYYLDIIMTQVNPDQDINIDEHKKSIRDMLDPFEGHLYECYNSKGKYDHNSLRYNAPHMSESAAKLKPTLTKYEFLSLVHREHAKPLTILIKEMQGLSGQKLLDYLYKNLKSVTILKEEARIIDKKYKTTMPDNTKIFSRFEEFGINIVKNN